MRFRSKVRGPAAPLLAGLVALLALPPCLGGLASPRVAEAGAPPLSWTYRDKVCKFSLKMFRDYDNVPLKAGEETSVCKFRDPKAKGAVRGSFPIEIEVVRVKLQGDGGPVTTGDGGEAPKGLPPEIERFRRGGPETVWEATVENLWLDDNGKRALKARRKEFKKIESEDKPAIPGKLWQFEIAVAQSYDGEKVHVTLAEFVKDDEAYGIFMTCGERLEKHYARGFKKIAESFRWFDDKAEDVETLDVLDGVNVTARKRLEIEKSMVAGWDVIISPKKNYIVIYNTVNGKNHLLAKVIAKRIEAIREQVYEVQFPPAKPIETVCVVRVCADAREYHAYGGPGGSAGYWSSGDEELVFYDASRSKKPDDDTLSVLYHEAFHQYIYYSVGNVAPHSWFNEGHGDYYAGADYGGGKFQIKPFAWRVGVVKGAIVDGPRTCEEVDDGQGGTRKQWGGKGYTPIKDLVHFTQREYYAYPSVSYAQGWALIYFLREIVPKNRKYREKWGHILDTYFDVLKREVNKDGALNPGVGAKKGDGEGGPSDDGAPGDGKEPGGDGPPTTGPDDGGKPDGDKPDGGKPDGGDDEGGEAEGPPPDVARVFFRGLGGAEALEKAVAEAFKGVDWEEFEAAWVEATKRGK